MGVSDLGFEVSFRAEPLDDGPAPGETVVSFARPRSCAGGLELETVASTACIRIAPATATAWIGQFEAGPGGVTGVFATPSLQMACVVVRGQGYWVPLAEPRRFEVIPVIPIRKVLAAPGAKIIFASDTRIAAYDSGGLAWQSRELSWDGLEIEEVTEDEISGMAWDAPAGTRVSFRVSLLTGASDGGSSPEAYRLARSSERVN